jgi:protease-4
LGEVGLTGLRSETPFLRGFLDKLGIAADFEHREEFKTAMNSLTETRMTGPQREEVEALLSSLSEQIDRGIATARKLTPDKVAAIVDRAPLSAEEARDAGSRHQYRLPRPGDERGAGACRRRRQIHVDLALPDSCRTAEF